MEILLVIIATFAPTPFLLWHYIKNIIAEGDEYTRWEIFWLFILTSIPLGNYILALIEPLDFEDKTHLFRDYKNRLNDAYRCRDCGITSRVWQLDKNDTYKKECSHCNSTRFSYYPEEEGDFPFAKRIGTISTLKRKMLINKFNNIRNKQYALEKYDDELVAYEKLQMKKLEEYQRKAEEIKKELKIN